MSDCLLLTGTEIRRLLPPAACREAVAAAFRASREGTAVAAEPLHVARPGGGFHAKSAVLSTARRNYFALKLNGNFPDNPATQALPTIQGVLMLADADDGRVLAILDSIALTRLRTAAATALAAQYLAPPGADRLGIVGCGDQAEDHLVALAAAFTLRHVTVFDIDPERARRFALRMAAQVAAPITVAIGLGTLTRACELLVTLTPSRAPFLGPSDVHPGTFIAAVGADHPDKNEIAPDLMAQATVIPDVLAQCLAMGDLHHAVAAGRMCAGQVPAELADVVTGRHPGRRHPDEIVVFDSTGSALQDVACAVQVFENAGPGHPRRIDWQA